MRKLLPALVVSVAAATLIPIGVVTASASHQDGSVRKIKVPEEDRFTPFAMTIRVGDAVKWFNGDSDDHTVVSDDAFNTAGHKGKDHLLPSGQTFVLTFSHPGVFVYYCRFHAPLDSFNQPVAPGPDGGIQDDNGNMGPRCRGSSRSCRRTRGSSIDRRVWSRRREPTARSGALLVRADARLCALAPPANLSNTISRMVATRPEVTG